MPALSEEFVVAPGKQRAAGIVLDEKVDIDQRHDAAGEEKDFFGEALAGITDDGFEKSSSTRQVVLHSLHPALGIARSGGIA
jgi:hypothetical protein